MNKVNVKQNCMKLLLGILILCLCSCSSNEELNFSEMNEGRAKVYYDASNIKLYESIIKGDSKEAKNWSEYSSYIYDGFKEAAEENGGKGWSQSKGDLDKMSLKKFLEELNEKINREQVNLKMEKH